ncbi:MAG: OmpA family protein [Bacteroidetes bacterium]|nr:MAG: OmpA family protein [Bacteroidota bacterium]
MKLINQLLNQFSCLNIGKFKSKAAITAAGIIILCTLSVRLFALSGGLDIKRVYDHLKIGNTEVLKDTVRMQNILFETGTAKLLPSDITYLNYISNYLIRIPTANLMLIGYTDNTGTQERNLELSRKRALAVKDYLISQRIPKSQIRSDGRGQGNPIADNSTPEGRQMNRRVELTFSSPENALQTGPSSSGPGSRKDGGSGTASGSNAGSAATAETYRIKTTSGETIDAQFIVFDEDGSVGYKVNFSGDFKKLRAAEISSITSSNGSVHYDEARVKEISKAAELPNLEPVYVAPAKSDAKPAFDVGSNTLGFALGTGVNYNYYGNYGFSPTFAIIFDHGTRSIYWGTIGIGGIVGYRSTTYNYSYGEYKAKWTNILVAFRGTYHITLLASKNNKFDPYIGIMAGVRINTYKDTYYDWYYSNYGYRYSSYRYNNVNALTGGFIGAKYNFAKTFGVFAEVGYDITVAKFGLNLNF